MIEIADLSKTYGTQRVVDGLTFTAPTGQVTGFLGPNGAGKSTTLRMLCGLSRPDSGSATIDGVRYPDLPTPGRTVGVMLDAAAQHPGRTGAEVLRLAAMADRLPPSVVGPMLERVGLADAAKKRVGAYSLGMRQRLGLGAALIGEPSTLVLDEPANGLDPAGIHWMRELLAGFAAAGGTVLLSSHLLGEVQAVADRIVVLADGRLVAEGETAQLMGSGSAQIVAATDPDALEHALREAGLPFTPTADGLRVEADAARIGALALEHRLTLTRLHATTGDLESLFLDLTAA